MINIFHKNLLRKPLAISPSIDFVFSMAKPITKPFIETLKKNETNQPKVLPNKQEKSTSFTILQVFEVVIYIEIIPLLHVIIRQI